MKQYTIDLFLVAIFIVWGCFCFSIGKIKSTDLDTAMIIESRTRHLDECLDFGHICMSALDECSKRLPK